MSRAPRTRRSIIREYGRMLVFVGLIIGLSSSAMVVAVGGNAVQAAVLGVVGLAVGAVTAGYLYVSLRALRQGGRRQR